MMMVAVAGVLEDADEVGGGVDERWRADLLDQLVVVISPATFFVGSTGTRVSGAFAARNTDGHNDDNEDDDGDAGDAARDDIHHQVVLENLGREKKEFKKPYKNIF